MNKADEWISLREFAKRLEVNVFAVQQALDNGRIERRASDKKIHWPSQSRSWEELRDLSKVRDDDEGNEDDEAGLVSELLSYKLAKARKEVASAGIKEHELAMLKGQVVNAGHARAAMTQFAIDVRESVMSIPERVANEMAAELAAIGAGATIEQIHDIVKRLWKREARQALETIASGDKRI